MTYDSLSTLQRRANEIESQLGARRFHLVQPNREFDRVKRAELDALYREISRRELRRINSHE